MLGVGTDSNCVSAEPVTNMYNLKVLKMFFIMMLHKKNPNLTFVNPSEGMSSARVQFCHYS